MEFRTEIDPAAGSDPLTGEVGSTSYLGVGAEMNFIDYPQDGDTGRGMREALRTIPAAELFRVLHVLAAFDCDVLICVCEAPRAAERELATALKARSPNHIQPTILERLAGKDRFYLEFSEELMLRLEAVAGDLPIEQYCADLIVYDHEVLVDASNMSGQRIRFNHRLGSELIASLVRQISQFPAPV